ncbi:MAG TPA: hypothetical protein VEC99_14795, partial [Clostridia bacterium]|nr:hypothetical protein [Clostridia bacterium]
SPVRLRNGSVFSSLAFLMEKTEEQDGGLMEYRHDSPVTKPKRTVRRRQARQRQQQAEELNRQRAQGGGQPNELGVTQGQNGEQGNTTNPANAQPFAEPGSE